MICGERSLSQPVPCLPIHFLSQVTAASNCFWIIPQIQKVHIQTNTDFYFLPHPFYTKDNLLYPVSISCFFPFTLYFGGLSIHVHRELHSVFIDLPNPGIKPRSPALQEASLPAEPPGKPKNTRVGSLSLLHQNFRTSQLRNWMRVSCIAGRFFTSRATREAPTSFKWFSLILTLSTQHT